jgi:hypothetical protein
MKATQEQYEKAAELYDNDGSVTDLYDYAEKLGIDEWSECVIAKAPDLLFAAKCALADLEGIMPEFEPSGDREHPAWETIKLLKKAIK